MDGLTDWRAECRSVIDAWADRSSFIIASPDVDGLLTTAVISEHYPAEVVGVYTGQHLVLFEGVGLNEAKEALWVDLDVSFPGVSCLGQHLIHHRPTNLLPNREPASWNPNVWLRQSWAHSFAGMSGKKRDKFPFATVHFVAEALGTDCTSPGLLSAMAHADGAWFALKCYSTNAHIWQKAMFENSAMVEIMMNYSSCAEYHATHAEFVVGLREHGIKKQQSRSDKARLLPEAQRFLTGSQSISGQVARSSEEYVLNIHKAAQFISTFTDLPIWIGKGVGMVVSGDRATLYPNRIDDFDRLMVDEKIFSHAFSDQRTLQYTTNIDLNTASGRPESGY
jgi:hypothetical protein